MRLYERILEHRVFRNSMYLGVIQVINYAIPLVVLVYLTKILGIDLYGIVAFSFGLSQLSFVFLDYGLNLSATQKISLWRDKKKYISEYIGSIYVIKFLIFILVSAVIVAYSMLSEKYDRYTVLFLLTLLGIFGQGFQPLWFFSGIEKMKFITIFTVTAKITYLIFVISLIKTSDNYLLIPISNGVAQIAALCIALYCLFNLGYRIKFPRYKFVMYTLKTSFKFFLSRLSVAIYGNSGTVLLGLFTTPALVAIYALAEQLYRVMQSVFMPVNQALYPYMAKEKNYILLLKILVVCVLLSGLGAGIGYFTSPYLVSFVFGEQWLTVTPVLNIFLLGIVIHVAGTLSGYPLAAALNKTEVANSSVIVSSFIYFIMILLIMFFTSLHPLYIALAVVSAELYVLAHRAVILWPLAYRHHFNNSSKFV